MNMNFKKLHPYEFVITHHGQRDDGLNVPLHYRQFCHDFL